MDLVALGFDKFLEVCGAQKDRVGVDVGVEGERNLFV